MSLRFQKLLDQGHIVIKDFFPPTMLDQINSLFIKEVDVENMRSMQLPGFKMGNLAINSCYLHCKMWGFLIDSGLIGDLQGRFPNYRYVSFGGNLNLPASRRQRLHIDSVERNLTINVPLVDVTKNNGAVSIIDTNYVKPHSTLDIFMKNLVRHEKQHFSNKGDIILRFASTWHRGNRNLSQEPRLMISFTLRESWPWAPGKDDSVSNLIFDKTENAPVSFSGNIYPNNFSGRVLEAIDFRVPSVSMTAQHVRNILKGR